MLHVYLRIRYVAHRPMPQEYDDERAITQYTDDVDDGHEQWHDIRFGSFIVRCVAIHTVLATF